MTDIEQRVRQHPFAACGVAAGVGVLLGPRLLPVVWRTLGVAGVAGLAAAKRTTIMNALLPDAVRQRLFGSERRV